MGYTLSKPYLLKFFDVKIQAKLSFGDSHGLCRLFSPTHEAMQSLQTILTADDATNYAKAKFEELVVGMLSNHKKQKKFRNGDELMESLLRFETACYVDQTLLGPLKQAMFNVCAFADPSHCKIEKLREAIDDMDSYEKDAIEDTCETVLDESDKKLQPCMMPAPNAIIEYMLGAGRHWFQQGEAAFRDRRAELRNSEEKASVLTMGNALVSSLEEFQPSSDFIDILNQGHKYVEYYTTYRFAKRAGIRMPWTKCDKEEMDNLKATATSAFLIRVKEFMVLRVTECMALAMLALSSDGYVDQSEDNQVQGPCEECQIEVKLRPTGLKENQGWIYICKQDVTCENFDKHANAIKKAIVCCLSCTRAYTLTKKQDAASLEVPLLHAVTTWLPQIGVAPNSAASKHWKHVVNTCLELQKPQAHEAGNTLNHIIKECVDGKFAKIDKTALSKVFEQSIYIIIYIYL